MSKANWPLVALTVGFSVATLASPALAQAPSNQGAAAQARAAAMRECNSQAEKYPQATYGHLQVNVYRSCMAQHGQTE